MKYVALFIGSWCAFSLAFAAFWMWLKNPTVDADNVEINALAVKRLADRKAALGLRERA